MSSLSQGHTAEAAPGGAHAFLTTHWSVVLGAGEESSPAATEALEKLCRAYWYPLYAYVRRRGFAAPDAQDLTQEFFARLVEKHYLAGVDRSKGKFRTFLLAALEHFLANQWRDARAQKRGGGQTLLSLDDAAAETRYHLEPVDCDTPEKIYERRWALTLLEQTLSRLREECRATDKTQLFDELKGVLSGEESERTYAEIAARLGMTEGAVKAAVHRLRQRYGTLLREEIAQTVASPEEIDEEIRHLFAAVT